ncbi:MAG: hypothetical protein KDC18_17450 [Alphaproteobacteria bacterium]|nr:hypothetical protein [Alphaproteobacteria bacterium]MCB9930792.1 hypothetical protein [Alphaproteobacteria bacterium]
MSVSTLILVAAAIGLALAVWLHPDRKLSEALGISKRQAIFLIPVIIPAIVSAGFVAQLLPSEEIGHWVGADSGFGGAMIAAAFGALMPTGPMLILPVVAALLSANAGEAQMLALLNAWMMMNAQRLLLYDIPLAGWSLTVRRYSLGVVLTPVAALLGLAIAG